MQWKPLFASWYLMLASSLMAAEPIRLGSGETHNFSTWAFQGVTNEVRLAVGLGTVELKQFDRQLLVSYKAPDDGLAGVEQIFIEVRDQAGATHARHLATVVLGAPKAEGFQPTTICVGHSSVLPVIAGDSRRPYLVLPLTAIYAERPANLDVTILGTEAPQNGFVQVKPLNVGTHNVIMISKNNRTRHGQVFGVDCKSPPL